ncbi:CDP-4-dehydro-6-deoxyglucose reductase [Anoxybacillus vitaminiphilus]|uniref:CDP-4-dehydro-6-deoxyglucose reductase n=1 Tax=Paranoxybacillus vitaminiphilus TaxID=581036 RepID=A0A327Y3G5_9BACL|nr:2Fe-2S iron-sulfur cluster-binding protein [Anoxybacillus vitaminiphilus]RAK14967.1 CDP-4-dehydro-6-deoxyglucose reductase [Anoxybacillus vitaminiphilus]
MYRINVGGKVFSCGENMDLLKAAKSQHVKIPYGCANGGCGMCKVKIKEGEYKIGLCSKGVLTDEERQNGYVLACKTYPLSHLVAELIEF